MARIKGWEHRLIVGMEDYLNLPFDWGTSNCGHGITTAVRACLGANHPIMQYLDLCHDEHTTREVLRHNGGLVNILGQYFTMHLSPLMASNGDVGVLRFVNEEVGCVVLDNMAVGKRLDGGVFRIGIKHMKYAFKV